MNKNDMNSIPVERYRLLFKGIVQGVGFRPYLYKSAQKFNLTGFVKNTSEGVIMEVEGLHIPAQFIPYVLNHFPPLAEVVDFQSSPLPVIHSTVFEILSSENTQKSDLLISPDIAICENCKNELLTPTDPRYKYPFINCTDCGPRMTIIQDLPYDRPKTTMSQFPMCPQCQKEYTNPLDRRYHAQPVSCFHCGPTLSIYDTQGNPIETSDPIQEASIKLKQGFVVAIKGLGGFHLACLATSDQAVLRLRNFKKREFKPFALMGTLEMIRENCHVSQTEEKHLSSVSAPILLLKQKKDLKISKYIAPHQNTLGFMLPYTPLHVLLLEFIQEPLVMTSANMSDEPIIYKNDLKALLSLSDYILAHDRDIHLFADDSVARVVDDQLYIVRRSRGYVPFPVTIPFQSRLSILALGPMLKTTFTLIRGNQAMTSPHIGDTESPFALQSERTAALHYIKIFGVQPQIIAVDKHPLYPNRLLAREFQKDKEIPIVEIQHHKAHVASLMAEKAETDPIIGIAMDGTGYGDDGYIWGGEFFHGDYRNITRFGHLKYLFLPSGDKSVKEPWRFALSILYSLYQSHSNEHVLQFAQQFGEKGLQQLDIIKAAHRGTGVLTSSCGRLFDAACSILSIGHTNDFDGHLPSFLQTAAEEATENRIYDFSIENEKDVAILNLLPAFHDIITDKRNTCEKALSFHKTLAQGIVEIALQARHKYSINKVGLTGGVFQNILLLKLTRDMLLAHGFEVLVHSRVPSNDGGISLGQAFLAAAENM